MVDRLDIDIDILMDIIRSMTVQPKNHSPGGGFFRSLPIGAFSRFRLASADAPFYNCFITCDQRAWLPEGDAVQISPENGPAFIPGAMK